MSAQSDQSISCPPEDAFDPCLPAECHAKTQLRLRAYACCVPAQLISYYNRLHQRFYGNSDIVNPRYVQRQHLFLKMLPL